MRIVVENGDYHLYNHGDVAMLQVAIARLQELWPKARIEVITAAPDLLKTYCPTAHPLNFKGHYGWDNARRLFRPVHRLVPKPVSQVLTRVERAIWFKWPALALRWLRFSHRSGSDLDLGEIETFLGAILEADLVVASGGGYIADAFRRQAALVLEILELAAQLGKPTAMFSQGLGPVQHAGLRARVRKTLTAVDVIALREDRAGLPFLKSLGISPDRAVTTGDDALEPAYIARAPGLGNSLGVGLRATAYSAFDDKRAGGLPSAIRHLSRKHAAPVVPIPISFHSHDEDAKILRRLLSAADTASDGGQSLSSPQEIISQVSLCRLVIAGSYHAAVFALAQGIPALCLARADYYQAKFLGLADQFGPGCEVMVLDDSCLSERLEATADHLWQTADLLRPGLLAAAQRQIEAGRAAYQRLYDLVGQGDQRRSPATSAVSSDIADEIIH
jgi:polysaccharide pyruvyl transferase WcaK-like protein